MAGGGLAISLALIIASLLLQPNRHQLVIKQAIRLGIPISPKQMITSDSDECPSWCGQEEQPVIKLTFNDCKCAKTGKPRGYRSYGQQDLMAACKAKGVTDCPTSLGLEAVRVSGSGQFCWHQCGPWLMQQLRQQSPHAMLIDLRMEAHGFLDKRPVSWFCPTNWERLGWEASDLEPDEQGRLAALGSHVEVYTRLDGTEETHHQSTMVKVAEAKAERDLVEAAGIHYHRLHVPDHCHPLDPEVDELVRLWDGLPTDYWVHFHCKAGKGRTSTLMLLLDMLHNAHQVSLRDLIFRQYVIGLVDLGSLEGKRDSYKYEPAVERLAFLQRFYEFARWRRHQKSKIGWIEWQRQLHEPGWPLSWLTRLHRYLQTQWGELANIMQAYE